MSEPIWKSNLDGKYDVRVVPHESGNPHHGRLQILRQDEVLLDESVAVSYGAMFGPDVGDIAAWQERACEFVDSL